MVGAWLVYSVFRRLLGLAIVIALAIGAWVLWSNPEMLRSLTDAAMRLWSSRS